MTAGYTRQAAANISAGLAINSADLNAEYNQLVSAFDNTTGHDHSGGATGVGAKISLTTAVTGILPVANGGTAIASGTSGGVLAFTGATTLASSAALTQYAIIIGGGVGAVPTAVGSIGTATTLLHGNAAGAPTFSAVSLTADVSGILPVASGGTAIASGTSGGVLAFTGATTVASSALLTNNALMLGGGAAATPKVVASLGTTTTVLHGNAAGAPTWSQINLTTDVTGVLPAANGGSGGGTSASISAQLGPYTTTSATLKMTGFAQTLTPNLGGRLLLVMTGDIASGAAGSTLSLNMRYGTGAAPTSGDALTGTSASTTVAIKVPNNNSFPFALSGLVSGLTLSTVYWIDLAWSITSNTGTLENINLNVIEL